MTRPLPLLLVLGLGCTPAPDTPGSVEEAPPTPAAVEPQPAPRVVVLISLDTTRADDLSCYGDPVARTPNLDALAARGVRFDMALSQAPTTLASHASLFSGRDGHGTGVVRNGVGVLPELPLLAEQLAAAGWDTQAVIGASVLGASQGLARGFRVYDDDVGDNKVRRRYEDDAPGVTRRALAAVDGREAGKPLFLFVHYFDAHMPWTNAPRALQEELLAGQPLTIQPTPGMMRQLSALARANALDDSRIRQARVLHKAEVAWVDQSIDILVDGLEQRGLLSNSLIVALADHGESLGEPNASEGFGHGQDVDGPVLRVPLILAGQGELATPAGKVIGRQVRLMDVGTTLLTLSGVGGRLGEGEDLSRLWTQPGQPHPAPPSFAEASKPGAFEREDAWNNLNFERSVASGGHMLVRTPWQGDATHLYRLSPDWPEIGAGEGEVGEAEADDGGRIAAALRASLARWDAEAPAHRDVSVTGATGDMLQALGYVEKEP